jgi:prepilin-type N-terminal cleavage/methylation domain-containing protein
MLRAGHDESGVTLIELLIVLTLVGVIGGVVTSGIVSAFASSRATTARVHALNELEIALQRVTADLRAAEEFVLSDSGDFDTELGLVVTIDGERKTVRYLLEPTGDNEQALIRQDTGQTLVTLVVNSEEDEPVFRYLDRFGVDLKCEPIPEDCSVTRSDADIRDAYKQAASLDVRLVRGIEGSTPVMVETTVSVRNIRYGSVS